MERTLAGQHLVEHDAERENIRPGINRFPLACSGDMTVRTNDRTFTAATDFLHACAVSIDGQTVVAGGQGGVLRVWNAKDGKIRDSFEPQPTENAQAAK